MTGGGGHVRRRGKRSWELKWELPRDSKTGKRVTRYKSVRGTKKDAEAELRRVLVQRDSGVHLEPHRLSLTAYLEQWLDRHEKTGAVSPKTAERYRDYIDNQIASHTIGSEKLIGITATRLEDFYADMLDHGRKDGGGGLAPQTVKHIDRLLHKSLKDARRQKLIATNPVDDAEGPKVKKRPKRTLSDDELTTLMQAAEGGPLYAPLFTIFATGVRRSELLALRWRVIDVEDVDNASLEVVEALEETKSGVRFKEPKSEESERRIDLPETLAVVLRQYQLEQKREHLRLGLGWSRDELVFGRAVVKDDSTIATEPWRPRNFTKAISRLSKRAGLEGVTPHVGRHDHATRLLRENQHPKVAQERLGHASIAVTMDVYSHAAPSMQRAAAKQIDTVLKKVREPD